ncbi:plasmid recombination protein [Ramlibacter alkalitolerans]|uniref:Plasmid recombination protein n=2 Tax=Ramlibacter alkalitolerans TaxID=2039631 RepID=A0ABS1JSW3_9BURK|nr:plasmid recombination protein [Ramlibacter alkalitolerans]
MAAISAASEHHMQNEPSPHHDPSAGRPLVLHLAAGKTPYQAARHLLQGVERRNRETVLCREVVLCASPSYFRPGREEQAGVADPERLKAWTIATLAWVKRQWPDQVASIVLHGAGRESTPHCHILVVPRVRAGAGWKLNSKALFDRARLRELQSSYAEALAPLGIRRGEPGSEAKHSEVKQFYGVVQAAKKMPERAPLPPAPKAPMPPGKLAARVWSKVLDVLGIESGHARAMRAHRQQLAIWRQEVRSINERNEHGWQVMRAAASLAPLARKGHPVERKPLPARPSGVRLQPRSRPPPAR